MKRFSKKRRFKSRRGRAGRRIKTASGRPGRAGFRLS